MKLLLRSGIVGQGGLVQACSSFMKSRMDEENRCMKGDREFGRYLLPDCSEARCGNIFRVCYEVVYHIFSREIDGLCSRII